MVYVLVWLLLNGIGLTVGCIIGWRFANRHVAGLVAGILACATLAAATIGLIAVIGAEELESDEYSGWAPVFWFLVLQAPLLFTFAAAAGWLGAKR